jgi:hypothetical protein
MRRLNSYISTEKGLITNFLRHHINSDWGEHHDE